LFAEFIKPKAFLIAHQRLKTKIRTNVLIFIVVLAVLSFNVSRCLSFDKDCCFSKVYQSFKIGRSDCHAF
jgi:hypothetical protein